MAENQGKPCHTCAKLIFLKQFVSTGCLLGSFRNLQVQGLLKGWSQDRPFFYLDLWHDLATVHLKNLTGDVATSGIIRQKEESTHALFSTAQAPHWNRINKTTQHFGTGVALMKRGFNNARGDRIDPDLVLDQFLGHRARQGGYKAFASCV